METHRLEQLLQANNIRPTAMRLLVLDVLLRQKSAASLTQLELDLAPADRVTVFRTIKTFEKQGMVHKVQDGSGTDKFAICVDDCADGVHNDLHVHFTCTACQETFCLPKSRIPAVTLPAGYQPFHTELTVTGKCPACQ